MDTLKKIVPILVVIVAMLWSVWGVVGCLSCVADFGRDGDLITWIINTAGENVYGLHSGKDTGIFDGNILYPYKGVLAYSEMFFLTSLWVYPAAKLFFDPLVVSGLALIFGQVIVGGLNYGWWKKLSGNSWAAAIMAIGFGVSQIRMHYQVHLQMWSMQYMLAGLWLIYDWMGEKKDWKLFAGAFLLGLHVWESLLPVAFALLVVAVWFLIWRNRMAGYWKKLILAGGVSLAVAVIPLTAYFGVSREFEYKRGIRDAAHNGMSVNDLWGRFASPGLYAAWAGAGIYMWRRRRELFKNREARWLASVGMIAVVLALGPVLKWDGKTVKIFGDIFIPLPYAAAYYLVPGFGAFRTPSRWIWLFAWAVSGLAAVGLGWALRGKKAVVIAGLLLLVLAGGSRVENLRQLAGGAESPEAYRWLAGQSGRVVLTLPFANDDSQTEPMLYLLGTDKYLLNGYTGFMPPEREKSGQLINEHFGTPEGWKQVGETGADWVVVDKRKMNVSGISGGIAGAEYEDEHYLIIRVSPAL